MSSLCLFKLAPVQSRGPTIKYRIPLCCSSFVRFQPKLATFSLTSTKGDDDRPNEPKFQLATLCLSLETLRAKLALFCSNRSRIGKNLANCNEETRTSSATRTVDHKQQQQTFIQFACSTSKYSEKKKERKYEFDCCARRPMNAPELG